MRFAPLDPQLTASFIRRDIENYGARLDVARLGMSCCDQISADVAHSNYEDLLVASGLDPGFRSYGPTRADIEEIAAPAAHKRPVKDVLQSPLNQIPKIVQHGRPPA